MSGELFQFSERLVRGGRGQYAKVRLTFKKQAQTLKQKQPSGKNVVIAGTPNKQNEFWKLVIIDPPYIIKDHLKGGLTKLRQNTLFVVKELDCRSQTTGSVGTGVFSNMPICEILDHLQLRVGSRTQLWHCTLCTCLLAFNARS